MIKKLLGLILFSFTIFFFAPSVFAQSGCCSWHGGESYCSGGRWVCADGTYSPTCTCGFYNPQPVYYPVYVPVYVPPPAPKAPYITASFTLEPNSNGTYNVNMTWSHVTNTGFSLALHYVPGGDPGPLTDTTNDYFTFYNINPGTYYADMKVDINGVWSTITYWKVTVPAWVAPTSTPSPTPFVANTVSSASSDGVSNAITFLIIFACCVFAIIVIANLLKWLIQYAKHHEWVYTVLIYGAIIAGFVIWSKLSSGPTQSTTSTSPTYTCDCSKTCTQITTCAEAYYQLNTCGCSVRDGDHDGIPCENLCH